ncbi:MAG: hypothetical protein WCC25_09915 [Candidatus Korobacteraceae bacterium]
MLVCSILIVLLMQVQASSDKASATTSPADSSQQSASTSAGHEPPQTQQKPQSSPSTNSEQGWYKVPPMPATNGTPGVYTVVTAESLPKGVFTLSGYTNKFGRAPGSATVLGVGVSGAVGLTNKITVFGQFEPYQHLHIGEPSQLSLRQPAGCLHDVFNAPIYCGGPPPGPGWVNSWKGPAASYVPDFPYAAYDKSDWGPVTLGVKVNFYSETRNDPLSVALSAGFVIPTESAATELSKFGLQSGTMNYSIGLALSKTLWREFTMANNVTYVITRNPQIGNETLYTPGDEIIFGQAFIFRSQHRLQFLNEYTCEMTQEGHAFGLIGIDTENTSLGPSDPVDGVWGLRWYFSDSAAVDVGYRYMMNLHQLNDRSGFTIKISKVFGWSKH